MTIRSAVPLSLIHIFAHKLGITDVVTHMGFIPENPYDPNFSSFCIAVRTVAEHLKKNGQCLLFETGQETPVTMLRCFEAVGTDNLYVNLDTANLILYGKANPADALDVFGKYVRNLHAKDGCYPTNGHEMCIRDRHRFLHAGYKDILVRTMNAIIDSELFRTEGDDIFQGLCIGSAADDHRLVCGVAGHIYIRLVQSFYERGLSREKYSIADVQNLDPSVLILQLILAQLAEDVYKRQLVYTRCVSISSIF